MPTVLELAASVRELAPDFARKVKAAAKATEGNEAEFRSRAYVLIKEFSDELELDLQPREEYTVATGRIDAAYNRLVVEYKAPGRIMTTAGGNRKWTEQTIGYLKEIPRRERHKPERLAGVVWDGVRFIFIMPRDTGWYTEDPVQVDAVSCERFLSLLTTLRLDRAVQPEYLIRDFGEGSWVASRAVSTLYDVLGKTDVPFAKKMFEQWSMQFKEVCDYERTSKLDLAQEAERFGIKDKDVTPFRFFFCLHTYYATFIKLLAVQVAQFYLMPKLGTNLHQAASYEDLGLRAYMDKLERGGLFKDFGINNFLEGDFFKWYVEAWDERVAGATREVIKALANYSLVTLDADPGVTRDILKALYQGLVPKRLRHNLGEYYTPDWLAERLIDMTVVGELKPTDRLLDPACGSGTFLFIAIRKMMEHARKRMLPEQEVLDKILVNVVGFDLNPLAVVTARTNYLLALSDKRYDLLRNRKSDISIPVYLCDSVVHPREVSDVTVSNRPHFPVRTAVGTFNLPTKVIRRDLIVKMATELESMVAVDLPRESFTSQMARGMELDPTRDAEDLTLLWQLYQSLVEHKKNKVNGVWASVIKNAFAPVFLKRFDYVVGNPPWINWESLPETYRQESKPLWDRYGLFAHSGIDVMLGKGKKDISMLMSYVVADKNLTKDGRLGFLITQSVFKTDAGRGFRRFSLPDGIPLGVIHVDDIAAFQPFEGATNRTAAFILQKGRNTEYGKSWYMMWLKRPGASGSLPQDATLADLPTWVDFNQFVASPVDRADHTSQWLTGRPLAVKGIQKVLGQSDYTAHAGSYTGGANGVYWVEIMGERPGGLVVVANITEGAKREVEAIQAPLERDLLYPLLRGRDVSRWQALPSAHILVTQDPRTRQGIPESEMKSERLVNTWKYLKRFEPELRARKSRGVSDLLAKGAPFWTMFAVSDYTLAPWKVLWREQARGMTAAVTGPQDGKPVVPDHKSMLVGCDESREAHYLCGALNSSPAAYAVAAYAIEIQMDTHVLQNIRVPRFDPKDPVHAGLAKLSEQAHEAMAKSDTERVTNIEGQVDLLAAKLWGLSDKELKEIKLALEELR